MTSNTENRRIYSVSRLNQEVQQLLETGFGTLWLQGEISNFSRPASGHFYFSLKDSQSQIRCAMFRGRNRNVNFKPQNGDAVLLRGKLSLYTARGDFQLIVEHMEAAGAGQLQLAFEATKRKLDEQGWFDQASKHPLPAMPQNIGVVTSATGAAIRDVLQVLARRYPQASVIVYPTRVQAAAAAPEIVKALHCAARRNEVEVVLLVRGGGSLEDLWGFNEISVAEAIRHCPIPIVCGVGHEIDVTIADLVADVRAPTPSAAAELATPDGLALLHRAAMAGTALQTALRSRLQQYGKTLQALEGRLQVRHPARQIMHQGQRVDDLESRLQQALARGLQRRLLLLGTLSKQLHSHSPRVQLAQDRAALRTWQVRLQSITEARLARYRSQLEVIARALNTVSPLATLERGFAVVRQHSDVLTDASKLSPGDRLTTRLASGEFDSSVVEIRLQKTR